MALAAENGAGSGGPGLWVGAGDGAAVGAGEGPIEPGSLDGGEAPVHAPRMTARTAARMLLTRSSLAPDS